MKLNLTVNDPAGVYESIREAVREEVSKIEGLSDDEIEALEERRIIDTCSSLKKWIEDGRDIRIEFDTEEGTATVLRA